MPAGDDLPAVAKSNPAVTLSRIHLHNAAYSRQFYYERAAGFRRPQKIDNVGAIETVTPAEPFGVSLDITFSCASIG
jgi:hypothetical protein